MQYGFMGPVKCACLRVMLLLVSLALGACRSDDADTAPVADSPRTDTVAETNQAEVSFPLWAYGVLAPPQPGDQAEPQSQPGPHFRTDVSREEQLRPRSVAGSKVSYTAIELSDWQHAPDWFPETHGPVPIAITRGPASLGDQTRACGFCHRIHGGGRPENAPVYGLPVAYFLRQIEDFRAGRRHSADPRKPNVPTMIALAQALSDEEALAVAEFWGAQDGGPALRVIESEYAPPVRLRGNLFVKTAEALTEPLIDRILEVPERIPQPGDLDDPRNVHVAYVPRGAIARGRILAETGRRDGPDTTAITLPCASCHGPALTGLGDAPPIAGRSPSYLARQLHGFRTGARRGTLAQQMTPVVALLDAGDLVDLTAYIASLPR
ncbi:MAG: cytochrome c [Lysobacterales bacterium]